MTRATGPINIYAQSSYAQSVTATPNSRNPHPPPTQRQQLAVTVVPGNNGSLLHTNKPTQPPPPPSEKPPPPIDEVQKPSKIKRLKFAKVIVMSCLDTLSDAITVNTYFNDKRLTIGYGLTAIFIMITSNILTTRRCAKIDGVPKWVVLASLFGFGNPAVHWLMFSKGYTDQHDMDKFEKKFLPVRTLEAATESLPQFCLAGLALLSQGIIGKNQLWSETCQTGDGISVFITLSFFLSLLNFTSAMNEIAKMKGIHNIMFRLWNWVDIAMHVVPFAWVALSVDGGWATISVAIEPIARILIIGQYFTTATKKSLVPFVMMGDFWWGATGSLSTGVFIEGMHQMTAFYVHNETRFWTQLPNKIVETALVTEVFFRAFFFGVWYWARARNLDISITWWWILFVVTLLYPLTQIWYVLRFKSSIRRKIRVIVVFLVFVPALAMWFGSRKFADTCQQWETLCQMQDPGDGPKFLELQQPKNLLGARRACTQMQGSLASPLSVNDVKLIIGDSDAFQGCFDEYPDAQGCYIGLSRPNHGLPFTPDSGTKHPCYGEPTDDQVLADIAWSTDDAHPLQFKEKKTSGSFWDEKTVDKPYQNWDIYDPWFETPWRDASYGASALTNTTFVAIYVDRAGDMFYSDGTEVLPSICNVKRPTVCSAAQGRFESLQVYTKQFESTRSVGRTLPDLDQLPCMETNRDTEYISKYGRQVRGESSEEFLTAYCNPYSIACDIDFAVSSDISSLRCDVETRQWRKLTNVTADSAVVDISTDEYDMCRDVCPPNEDSTFLFPDGSFSAREVLIDSRKGWNAPGDGIYAAELYRVAREFVILTRDSGTIAQAKQQCDEFPICLGFNFQASPDVINLADVEDSTDVTDIQFVSSSRTGFSGSVPKGSWSMVQISSGDTYEKCGEWNTATIDCQSQAASWDIPSSVNNFVFSDMDEAWQWCQNLALNPGLYFEPKLYASESDATETLLVSGCVGVRRLVDNGINGDSDDPTFFFYEPMVHLYRDPTRENSDGFAADVETYQKQSQETAYTTNTFLCNSTTDGSIVYAGSFAEGPAALQRFLVNNGVYSGTYITVSNEPTSAVLGNYCPNSFDGCQSVPFTRLDRTIEAENSQTALENARQVCDDVANTCWGVRNWQAYESRYYLQGPWAYKQTADKSAITWSYEQSILQSENTGGSLDELTDFTGLNIQAALMMDALQQTSSAQLDEEDGPQPTEWTPVSDFECDTTRPQYYRWCVDIKFPEYTRQQLVAHRESSWDGFRAIGAGICRHAKNIATLNSGTEVHVADLTHESFYGFSSSSTGQGVQDCNARCAETSACVAFSYGGVWYDQCILFRLVTGATTSKDYQERFAQPIRIDDQSVEAFVDPKLTKEEWNNEFIAAWLPAVSVLNAAPVSGITAGVGQLFNCFVPDNNDAVFVNHDAYRDEPNEKISSVTSAFNAEAWLSGTEWAKWSRGCSTLQRSTNVRDDFDLLQQPTTSRISAWQDQFDILNSDHSPSYYLVQPPNGVVSAASCAELCTGQLGCIGFAHSSILRDLRFCKIYTSHTAVIGEAFPAWQSSIGRPVLISGVDLLADTGSTEQMNVTQALEFCETLPECQAVAIRNPTGLSFNYPNSVDPMDYSGAFEVEFYSRAGYATIDVSSPAYFHTWELTPGIDAQNKAYVWHAGGTGKVRGTLGGLKHNLCFVSQSQAHLSLRFEIDTNATSGSSRRLLSDEAQLTTNSSAALVDALLEAMPAAVNVSASVSNWHHVNTTRVRVALHMSVKSQHAESVADAIEQPNFLVDMVARWNQSGFAFVSDAGASLLVNKPGVLHANATLQADASCQRCLLPPAVPNSANLSSCVGESSCELRCDSAAGFVLTQQNTTLHCNGNGQWENPSDARCSLPICIEPNPSNWDQPLMNTAASDMVQCAGANSGDECAMFLLVCANGYEPSTANRDALTCDIDTWRGGPKCVRSVDVFSRLSNNDRTYCSVEGFNRIEMIRPLVVWDDTTNIPARLNFTECAALCQDDRFECAMFTGAKEQDSAPVQCLLHTRLCIGNEQCASFCNSLTGSTDMAWTQYGTRMWARDCNVVPGVSTKMAAATYDWRRKYDVDFPQGTVELVPGQTSALRVMDFTFYSESNDGSTADEARDHIFCLSPWNRAQIDTKTFCDPLFAENNDINKYDWGKCFAQFRSFAFGQVEDYNNDEIACYVRNDADSQQFEVQGCETNYWSTCNSRPCIAQPTWRTPVAKIPDTGFCG